MKVLTSAITICLLTPMIPVHGSNGTETRTVDFVHGGVTYSSTVVSPESDKPLPGVLMVPNWLGVTPDSIEKARRVATEAGVVVYVADVYGKDNRPAGPREAGPIAGHLKSDPAELTSRTQAALEHFQSLAKDIPFDSGKMAAIGFCFGGSTVLELARTGTPLKAFVSFHGSLDSPTLVNSGKIRGSVLVLHGDADPFVPHSEVRAFEDAMRKTSVDWELVSFGGAVHSFTNPQANDPGKALYDPRAAARAFAAMRQLFSEVF